MNEHPDCKYETTIKQMNDNINEIKTALLGDMKNGDGKKAGLIHRTYILECWKSGVNKILGTFATFILGGIITWVVTR